MVVFAYADVSIARKRQERIAAGTRHMSSASRISPLAGCRLAAKK
jgi:hypothetical protein